MLKPVASVELFTLAQNLQTKLFEFFAFSSSEQRNSLLDEVINARTSSFLLLVDNANVAMFKMIKND
jgi:hypothetical protein